MGVDWAPLVTPFLLPISYIWDAILYLSIVLNYYIRFRSDSHKDRVEKVQAQVRQWKTEGDGRKMCTARPSWMSISQQKVGYKDTMYRINVSLHNVLEIDKKNMLVTVEPSVPIGFLNRLLVKQGCTLPVVPEIDLLTIGGLVMGGGLESTSHKYGMFHHICERYELVTADGECRVADAENNSDLFHAVPMSYGTLGFLTSVTIRMIPYKPYLKLTYRPTYSQAETLSVFETETNKATSNDSVEGIMYSNSKAVIMTGVFVEEEEVEQDKINRMGLWFKPWFYKYVETFINKGETVEYVPTLDFHQRHNKGMFWLTPLWLPWAHNVVARYLMGWLLPMNHQLLSWCKETFVEDDYGDDFILQDFMVPIHHLKEAINLSTELTDVWPVWLVPARLYQPQVPKVLLPRSGDVIYIDVGIYGKITLNTYKGRDPTLRAFERWTLENGGYQALYAETLMTFDEFCEMFDGTLYEKVRKSLPYCEEAFPTVYEKVSREGRRANSARIRQRQEQKMREEKEE